VRYNGNPNNPLAISNQPVAGAETKTSGTVIEL